MGRDGTKKDGAEQIEAAQTPEKHLQPDPQTGTTANFCLWSILLKFILDHDERRKRVEC